MDGLPWHVSFIPLFVQKKKAPRIYALCGADAPDLHQTRDARGILIDLPGYDLRKAIQTADPMAVMEAFKVSIRFVLPRVFGYRMCPFCPSCALTNAPCSNKFGNNFEPWGGIAGLAAANFCAVEYQHTNNPHAHGHVHLVSAYQHKILEEIKALIEEKLLSPETIFDYQETLQRTELFDHEKYEEAIPEIEEAWRQKFKDPVHDDLTQLPEVVFGDHTKTIWNGQQDIPAAISDASTYTKAYKREAQSVMTRCNHHVHLPDPVTNQRVPLPGCRSKKARTFLIEIDLKTQTRCEKQIFFSLRFRNLAQFNIRNRGALYLKRLQG